MGRRTKRISPEVFEKMYHDRDVHDANRGVAYKIIEVFESFLTDRHIRIPTSDEEVLLNGEEPEKTTKIIGYDYAELEGLVVEVLDEKEGVQDWDEIIYS